MAAKKLPRWNRVESTPPLPLDVTQDIDPALVEEMLRSGAPTSSERTWTQVDFDEITIELPVHRKPKP